MMNDDDILKYYIHKNILNHPCHLRNLGGK